MSSLLSHKFFCALYVPTNLKRHSTLLLFGTYKIYSWEIRVSLPLSFSCYILTTFFCFTDLRFQIFENEK